MLLVEKSLVDPYRPPDDPDSSNPYAAPRATFRPEAFASSHDPRAIPCSIDAIVNTAWSIYSENLWTCTWLSGIVSLAAVGLYFAQRVVLASLRDAMPGQPSSLMPIGIGLSITSAIIQAWLGIGLKLALLRIVRGQPASGQLLVSGGRYVLTTLLAWLVFLLMLIPLLSLPIFVTGFAGAFVGQQPGTLVLIMLAACLSFLLLAFYTCTRFMQYPYLIADREAGVLDSLQRSCAADQRSRRDDHPGLPAWRALFAGGLITCCVGFIFTMPLAQMILAVTYLSLVGPAPRREHVPFLAEPAPLAVWEEDL